MHRHRRDRERPSPVAPPTVQLLPSSAVGLGCVCLALVLVAPALETVPSVVSGRTGDAFDETRYGLHAQQADDIPTVGLDEAIRLFHENSPEMALTRARLREAAGRARQSDAFPNPSIGATHESLSGGGLDVSETYVTVTQPFEWPGRRSARSRAGDRRYDQARARFRADSAALIYEVRRAYLEAAEATARLDILEAVASVFRKSAGRAEIRFADGDISRYVMERLRLERLRYERSLAAARIEAGAARQALATMILPEGASGGDGEIRTEGLPPGLPPTLDAGAPRGDAVERHPTVVAARAAVEAARAEVDVAESLRYPDPAVTGGYKTQSNDQDGVFLGISLPVPVLDRKGGRVEATRSRFEAEESRLGITRRSARRELQRALIRYRSLRAQAELFTEESMAEGDDLLTIARAAFQEGEMDLIELTDAARARRDAVVLTAELQREVWTSYYELVRASGGAFADPASNEVNP